MSFSQEILHTFIHTSFCELYEFMKKNYDDSHFHFDFVRFEMPYSTKAESKQIIVRSINMWEFEILISFYFPSS